MGCVFCKFGKCTTHETSPGALDAPAWLKKGVDGKTKTGDRELVRLLLHAWLTLGSTAEEQHEEALKAYETQDAEYDSDPSAFLPLGKKIETLSKAKESALKYLGNLYAHHELDPLKLREKLAEVYDTLASLTASDGLQFIVNLCLVNYRTAQGGRLRKSTSLPRSANGEGEYMRPFVDALPPYVAFLLSPLLSKGLSILAPTVLDTVPGEIKYSTSALPKDSARYHPPSRFTASFLASATERKDFASHYEELGSFGFAEPSFGHWSEGFGGGEHAGTRVSLGAYSLNPDYLEEVSKRLEHSYSHQEGKSVYKNYGGARPKHLQYLKSRFGASQTGGPLPPGLELSLAWIQVLQEIALAVVERAQHQDGSVRPFFSRIAEKIAKRGEKLAFVLQQGSGLLSEDGMKVTELFDKVWILESTLWEFMLLGAAFVPIADLIELVRQRRLTPAVAPTPNLTEDIHLGEAPTFTRVFFPTGTAAALGLQEHLLEKKCPHLKENFAKSELNPFKPYFEFYIPGNEPRENDVQDSAFLFNPSKPSEGRRAVWVNLSESLHSKLLGKQMQEVGTLIADKLRQYLGSLPLKSDEPVVVVADFTRFSGEMPNTVVYRILADLTRALSESKTCEIVFLRSNLKYNSGSLDRYQSGEVLIPPGTAAWFVPQELEQKAQEVFNDTETYWSLFGQYIPLMRKTYLLSDYVSQARWREYAK
ncbi:hypothetical protein D7X55_21525 [Corallococcus sp. AB049A]|uniref:hypothetical protein n=1 Tax=Corallococcus sp. AB049A TaxID=2316721 RepID=UPI000ED7B86A|nr:hypothetical protein [Corallococcus sp. AB049A]RKI62949.1 hypothetical protein D7X55_21525 [Corallococcus sp. AB049A]